MDENEFPQPVPAGDGSTDGGPAGGGGAHGGPADGGPAGGGGADGGPAGGGGADGGGAGDDVLARRFERQRPRLQAVAYRMLGSAGEADDAVQEAWLQLARTDSADVENLAGWLTTVVARVCLNMLRARDTRREEPLEDAHARERAEASAGPATDPEEQAVLADSVGVALLVVLDTLTPAERLAFVLHDLFAVPFEEIAPVVERTPPGDPAAREPRAAEGARCAGGTRDGHQPSA
jgi:RNA polymerase sigma-70 factor (ECF subfamily)